MRYSRPCRIVLTGPAVQGYCLNTPATEMAERLEWQRFCLSLSAPSKRRHLHPYGETRPFLFGQRRILATSAFVKWRGADQRYRWKHSEPLRLLAMTKSHQDRPAHEPIALPKGLPHELLLHSTGRAFVSARHDAIQVSDRPCQVLVIDSMLLYSRSLSCPMGPAS